MIELAGVTAEDLIRTGEATGDAAYDIWAGRRYLLDVGAMMITDPETANDFSNVFSDFAVNVAPFLVLEAGPRGLGRSGGINAGEESSLFGARAPLSQRGPASMIVRLPESERLPQFGWPERFRTSGKLSRHAQNHGWQFGTPDRDLYLQAALRAWRDMLGDPQTKIFIRLGGDQAGDIVLYRESTNELLIISHDNYIRTYFKPDRGLSYYMEQLNKPGVKPFVLRE
jgi:hypothetical protein